MSDPAREAWPVINRERARLIQQKILGTASLNELTRLEALQNYADAYLEYAAPLPDPMTRLLEIIEQLRQQLRKK